MTNLEQMEHLVRNALGESATVRTRRPRLFQVGVPAFLADGDGAGVFLREGDDGRFTVSDMGSTIMRLSYTRDVNDKAEDELARLAGVHGFTLSDGELRASIDPREIAAGVLGLVQIESEAEASIQASSGRGEQAAAFRAGVRAAIKQMFAEECVLNFHDEIGDPDGDFAIDAVVDGPKTLGIYVVGNDNEADSALLRKTKLDPLLMRRNPKRMWVAIPRATNDLGAKARRKLDAEYLIATPDRLERLSALRS